MALPRLACALVFLGACVAPAASDRLLADPRPVPRSAPETTEREPAQAPNEPRTLAALLATIQQRNPTLALARARVAAAGALLAQSQSVLRPRLEVSAVALRSDAPSTFLFEKIDAHRLAPGTDFNEPGTFGATQAVAALQWNLWHGGQDALERDAARAELEARVQDTRALESALVNAGMAAWLDVRATQELERSDSASVASLSAQLEEARARVAAGSALRTDELSLAVRLAQARERALATQRARRLALAALRALLAAEPAESLELAPGDPAFVPEPPTLALARDTALRDRAELQALERRLRSVDLRLVAARRAWLPSLDAELRSWAVDDHSGVDFGDANVEGRLALSWSLLDGGARSANVRAREAERTALAAQRRELELAIATEVEAAWIHLEESRAREGVAGEAREAATENLRLLESQYRAGSVPVSRFLDAESDRTRADADLVGARIDVWRARCSLERALGGLDPFRPEAVK